MWAFFCNEAQIRQKPGDQKRQVPLYDYCRSHPDDTKCNSPDGGPQRINVKPVDPTFAAIAIHNSQGKRQQDASENWNALTAGNNVGTRLWNLINSGTWTEQAILEVGRETGMNALVQAGTGEDILSNKLSAEQRIENAVEGTGKLLETTATVAAVVEVGMATKARKGAGAALEGVVEGGGCFAAGTLVLTPSGRQPIEAIREGDEVLSFCTQSGAVTRRRVLSTGVRQSQTLALYAATAEGETSIVRVTAEHPFLLCDLRWVEATLLRPGDCLLTAKGTAVLVAVGFIDGVEKVYNLEVEEDHDYFVTDLSVLVHNSSRYSRGIFNRGGRFAELDGARLESEVGHHAPQNKFNETVGLSRSDGPTLGMLKEDHALTRTFSGRGAATMRKDAELTFRQRLALDVKDIKSQFGSKYNRGLTEMVDYAKTLPEYKK